jgi:hypothetical protein
MTARIICLWWCLLLAAAAVRAQEAAAPEIVGIRVGFAGAYKVGLWTPVEVTLRGGGRALDGRLSLTVPDGEGVPSRVSTAADAPCRVPADGEAVVQLCVRFGRVNGWLKAELEVDGRVVAGKSWETAPQADPNHFLPAIESQKLIVAVGPAAFQPALPAQGPEAARQAVVAHLDDPRQLPTQWYGYEGVDALILSTSRPEIYRGLSAEDARVAALDEWISLGGRLLLCVGSQGEEILGPCSPLGRFAPGRLEEMTVLRQTAALETYCRSSTAVPAPAAGDRKGLRVPRLVELSGTVEAREGDLPLVVRTARGFGQILFLAVDLDQPPLSQWNRQDRGLLLGKLLDLPAPHLEAAEENAPVMHFGYTDLAGQLRSALDRFPGVSPVPFWAVAGLVVLYIVLIGPADYFFLRKVARRMEWTWLSFPLVVLAFSLAAYLLAYGLKGSQLCIHQVDLVDIDAASGRLRGTTWLNLLSPQSESFHLSFQPKSPEAKAPRDARVLLSWLGLPGGALGGMNPRAADPGLHVGQYEFSPRLDAIENLPIPVWSTRSLTARWTAAAEACLAADLTDENQVLSGTITNTCRFPLSQCILAHDLWAYELGTLQPGQSAHLGPDVRRSELKTLLTGRKIIFDKSSDKFRQELTPYDQSSTDVPYILRTMTFFEAAGGQRYTGLSNNYQAFVDLSGLLKTDRVILVAEGPAGDAAAPLHGELLRDGQPIGSPQDQHTIIYRFVMPLRAARGG